MDKLISPKLFVVLALGFLGLLLAASLSLPHERYYRFQAHDNVSTRKADWIYERLNFDETPIDVALIGTSRTAGGLSGPLIQTLYCEATGREIHVANLAIPVTGRNMHYVVAKEAARKKAPALTVVELNDVETRRPHPAFVVLADASDILRAPLLLNTNYFSDIIRLPGRQATLFIETLFGKPAVRAEFDPQDYAGANLDLTEVVISIDGQIKSRHVIHGRDKMNALQDIRMSKIARTFFLPKPLQFLEYRLSRLYLQRIQSEAAKIGGITEFAYIPAYGEPIVPDVLQKELSVDTIAFDLGGAITDDPSKWLDATHLNADGAVETSQAFAERLASAHPYLGEASADCQ